MKGLSVCGRHVLRRRTFLLKAFAQHRCASNRPFFMHKESESVARNSDPLQVKELLAKGLLFDGDSLNDSIVDPIRLRLHCNCDKCVDPSDGQKNYSLAYVPEDIGIRSYHVNKQGMHVIQWKNDVPGFGDDHVSTYSRAQNSMTERIVRLNGRTMLTRQQQLWDRAAFDIEDSTLEYDFYMRDDKGLALALHHLWRKGLVFIKNVPPEETSVRTLAERIALLRNTFYNPTWDVRSKPNAENVAYTSRYLGFHMDLLYMKEPPGLQFLHCIENTCEGGESAFADTYQALFRMERQHSELVNLLASINIPYGYRNGGNAYFDKKPVILKERFGFDHKNKIDVRGNRVHPASVVGRANRVYWSPPFVQQDDLWTEQTKTKLRQQQRALKLFADELEQENLRVETKLPAGTCAIFDNLRVVHARKAFDTNSGHRWLKGTYLDFQDFVSKAQSLESLMPEEQLGGGLHRFRVSRTADP